jgi:hypothetical protein
MRSGRECSVAVMIGVALFSLGCWPATAQGDGGVLRAWKQHGNYDVAVFTEPTPLVTGPVDISVLLLDRNTGEPIREARIMVEVSPVGRPAEATSHAATEQAATNKLLRAAVFELRESGPCEVNVSIDGPNDHVQIRFELNVGRPWSPRSGVWFWILWPVPVIVSYGIHRRLVGKDIKERGRKVIHPQDS